MLSVQQILTARSQLFDNVNRTKPIVESIEKTSRTLKGFSRWRPMKMASDMMSFCFVSHVPCGCVQISFAILDSGRIECRAFTDAGVHPRFQGTRPSCRFHVVENYIALGTKRLCEEYSKKELINTGEIRTCLQRLEWRLGRLEQTASELVMLHRRYRAILTPCIASGSSTFQLVVDFSSNSSCEKLSATFELSQAYPYAPLNVCLDTFAGSTDVEGLQRILIKNAKPGFGYLSRTCAMIAAFMK